MGAQGSTGFLRHLRNDHLEVQKQIPDMVKIHLRVVNSGRDAELGAGKPFSGQILEEVLMKF